MRTKHDLPLRHGSSLVMLAIVGLLAACAPTVAAAAVGDVDRPSCPARTEASPGFRSYLPDCRAYELIDPSFTDAQQLEPYSAAADRPAFIAASPAAFSGLGTSGFLAFYRLTRTAGGWATEPIDPPTSQPQIATSVLLAASTGLDITLWAPNPLEPAEHPALYLRRPDGAFTPVGPLAPVGIPFAERAQFTGASADLSRVLITVAREGFYWPGDTTTVPSPSLYQYEGAGDTEPRLVGVRNEGLLDGTPHVNERADLISRCGTFLGSTEGRDTYDAISESGNTVFFTAAACAQEPGEPEVGELYARIDAERTVPISEPSLPPGESCTGACATAPEAEGVFQGASADGSRVFFLTAQPLLDQDRDTTTDLYEAQLEDGKLRWLTLVSEGETRAETPEYDDPAPGQGAGVLGVVRVSRDGSHVFFVAEGVLTRRPNGQGATPAAGERNLYVFDALTGRTAFIVTLQSEAREAAAKTECAAQAGGERYACLQALAALPVWAPLDVRAAQATPDGRYLLFPSIAPLTPGDTSGPLAPQLFRYDTLTETLTRVSVGHDGYSGDGNTTSALDAPRIPSPYYAFTSEPTASALPLSIADDGTVVFRSGAPLTPEATPGVPSVYEYTDGNVYLISDGASTVADAASESGALLPTISHDARDVLFATAAPLLPQDGNTQFDLYDARAEGGFPPATGPPEPGPAAGGYRPPTTVPPTSMLPPEPGAAPAAPAPASESPSLGSRLARALRGCHARYRHSPRRRRACERSARHRSRIRTSATPPRHR